MGSNPKPQTHEEEAALYHDALNIGLATEKRLRNMQVLMTAYLYGQNSPRALAVTLEDRQNARKLCEDFLPRIEHRLEQKRIRKEAAFEKLKAELGK